MELPQLCYNRPITIYVRSAIGDYGMMITALKHNWAYLKDQIPGKQSMLWRVSYIKA